MYKSLTQKGFTLLEVLSVIVLMGVIAAIAAPSWLTFVEGKRLNSGRDKLYLGLREAQTKAQRRGLDWQFSLRERDGSVEWATHPKSVDSATVQWTALDAASLKIDEETTLATSGSTYYVRFDDDGNVQYRLGRVTLSSRRVPQLKRCVVVSTIIGAMRKSKEQATPRYGKFCY
ncbi:MAG: GspH/FimT family pseudopilin [Cyanobacteria bacterium J06649_4]